MEDKDWSKSVADLAADALIDAGLIQKDQLDEASDVIAEEVLVRLCMNDRPDPKQEAEPQQIMEKD